MGGDGNTSLGGDKSPSSNADMTRSPSVESFQDLFDVMSEDEHLDGSSSSGSTCSLSSLSSSRCSSVAAVGYDDFDVGLPEDASYTNTHPETSPTGTVRKKDDIVGEDQAVQKVVVDPVDGFPNIIVNQNPSHPSTIKTIFYKGIEIAYVVLPVGYAVASIVSGFPIPILVRESVVTFLDGRIFEPGSPWITALGNALGFAGVPAIVPFTVMNSYRFMHNLLKSPDASKLFYLLTLSSGVLNADNTRKALSSLGFSNAYVTVFAYLFGVMPGLSNGEVLSELFWKEGINDAYILRYLCITMRDYFPTPESGQGVSNPLSDLSCRSPNPQEPTFPETKSDHFRSILLGQLALFNLQVKLAVSDKELEEMLKTIGSAKHSSEETGDEFFEMAQKIKAMLEESSKLNFPLFKVLASEVVGSMVAAGIAIFGNVNSINGGVDVVRGLVGNYSWMLEYFLSDYAGVAIDATAHITGWLGAGISSAMWFYLLRNVVIRPFFHGNKLTWKQSMLNVLKNIAVLIPAAALAASNIIVTVTNPQLAGYLLILVLGSSLAGNAVLSLSGIPDGVRGLLYDFQSIKNRIFGGEMVPDSSSQFEQFYREAVYFINKLSEEELNKLGSELGDVAKENKLSVGDMLGKGDAVSFWGKGCAFFSSLNTLLNSSEVSPGELPTTTFYGSTGNASINSGEPTVSRQATCPIDDNQVGRFVAKKTG